MPDTLTQETIQQEATRPRHRRPAEVHAANADKYSAVLTSGALLFIADLERRFGRQRKILLETRTLAQARYDDGELPDFPPETEHASLYGKWRLFRRSCRIAAWKLPGLLTAR